jgi:hypothetical protein
MPTEIQVLSNYRAVAAQARAMRARVQAAVRKGLDDENDKTIVALTFGRMGFSKDGPIVPGGLRRISSTAVRSLRKTRAVNDGDGVTSSVGSNLKYLIAHEFGTDKVVTVPAHTRQNPRGDTFRVQTGKTGTIRGGATTFKKAKVISGGLAIFEVLTRAQAARIAPRARLGKAVASGVSMVKAHPMHMNLPARHMIRDTLAERMPDYSKTISDAISSTILGGFATAAKAPLEPMKGGAS